MRIGFDFDNTIVNYDTVFHRVALEQGITDAPQNKLALRDHLRNIGQEDIWTEMQGNVYGTRMHDAEAFPDMIDTMKKLRDAGHTLAIISHKTQFPFIGAKHDLHKAAREWILLHLSHVVDRKSVFFEVSKQEKLERIASYDCDIFIDDLPEILLADDFPKKTKRFLFDPNSHHKNISDVPVISSWKNVYDTIQRL